MKYRRILSAILLTATVLSFSCKKDTENNEQQNQVVTEVLKAISGVDSLKRFTELFKLLEIPEQDAVNGITVLAIADNNLVYPLVPQTLGDYIIKGEINPANFTNGITLQTISGKEIAVSISNNAIFLNGVALSSNMAANGNGYKVYTLPGLHLQSNIYNDPHANEYYIDYYENGEYKTLKGYSITSWTFLNSSHFPAPPVSNCSFPSYNNYGEGPSIALATFTSVHPFWMQVNRTNYTTIPQTGEYHLSKDTYNAATGKNNGNCNLFIGGATFTCEAPENDAYVKIKIDEVKIDEDLGLEKRGYYKGTFDAILYERIAAGRWIKKAITAGRFRVPIGGNEKAQLNAAPPNASNDLFQKISGRWKYVKNVNRFIINGMEETETENDEPGNYFEFKQDGSFAGLLEGGDDDFRGTWQLSGNKVSISVINEEGQLEPWISLYIKKITDNELVLYNDGTDEQGYWEITMYLSK